MVLQIQPAPRRQMCGAGLFRLSPCCHLLAAHGHSSAVIPTRVATHGHIPRQRGVVKAAPSSFPSTLRCAPWYPQRCIPIPTPATFPGNQCHQCQGGYRGEKCLHEQHSTLPASLQAPRSPYHCDPQAPDIGFDAVSLLVQLRVNSFRL